MTPEEQKAIDAINHKLQKIIDFFHIGQQPMKTVESINRQAQRDFEEMMRRDEK